MASKTKSEAIKHMQELINSVTPRWNVEVGSGLLVTDEMKKILEQPGFLNMKKGGQRLRILYVDQSMGFSRHHLSDFGQACYLGSLPAVQIAVQCGLAPDLSQTETAYKFGYATIVIAGAQRLEPIGACRPEHYEVLKYLISHSLPLNVPDVCGLTVLHHSMHSNIRFRKDETLRLMLESGADLDYQNRYGETPIFGAQHQIDILSIDILMEYGANIDIADADGLTPHEFSTRAGPQVRAAMMKWVMKRRGAEAPRTEKKCDHCGAVDKPLKNCSKCQVARYCSVECQRAEWKVHKTKCQPFISSNTVMLKPFYEPRVIVPTSPYTRTLLGLPTGPVLPAHSRSAHVPKDLSSGSKSLIVKVQIPVGEHIVDSDASLFIYTKKRDFVCCVRKTGDPKAYDRVVSVVEGTGMKKAYFAAELKNKDELILKISEILADQPF